MLGKFRRRWPLFFVLLIGLALPGCCSFCNSDLPSQSLMNPTVDEDDCVQSLDITPNC
jgi:hypothetical protein